MRGIPWEVEMIDGVPMVTIQKSFEIVKGFITIMVNDKKIPRFEGKYYINDNSNITMYEDGVPNYDAEDNIRKLISEMGKSIFVVEPKKGVRYFQIEGLKKITAHDIL